MKGLKLQLGRRSESSSENNEFRKECRLTDELSFSRKITAKIVKFSCV